MILLPDWLPRSNTVNLLAGVFLLSALFAASRRKVQACVTAYRWNSVALGLLALTVAVATGARHIVIAGVLVLVIKAGVIPALLHRRAVRGPQDVNAWLGIPAGSLLCGALVVIAFSQTRALFGTGHTILASCLPISVAVTLIGLFIMMSRDQALLQVLGLVLVENAIFLAAVSLTYGMPLVVEMGVLIDLFAGVALLGLYVGRLEDTPGDSDTSKLSELRG